MSASLSSCSEPSPVGIDCSGPCPVKLWVLPRLEFPQLFQCLSGLMFGFFFFSFIINWLSYYELYPCIVCPSVVHLWANLWYAFITPTCYAFIDSSTIPLHYFFIRMSKVASSVLDIKSFRSKTTWECLVQTCTLVFVVLRVLGRKLNLPKC